MEKIIGRTIKVNMFMNEETSGQTNDNKSNKKTFRFLT